MFRRGKDHGDWPGRSGKDRGCVGTHGRVASRAEHGSGRPGGIERRYWRVSGGCLSLLAVLTLSFTGCRFFSNP